MASRIKSAVCLLLAVALLGAVGYWGYATAKSTDKIENTFGQIYEQILELLPNK